MLTARLLRTLVAPVLALVMGTGVAAAPAFSSPITERSLSSRDTPGPFSYSGRLLVRNTNGTILGFVRRELQDDGTVRADFGNTSSSALWFWFSGDTNGNTETASGLDLQIVRKWRTEDPSYQWLAGVLSSEHNVGDALAPGSANFALLSPSPENQDKESLPAEAVSLFNDRANNTGKQETAIWSYTPRMDDETLSQRITAKWTNPDGNTVDAAIVATRHGLVVSGDAYACAKTFGGYEVRLYLS